MASSFTRCGQRPPRVRSFNLVSSVCALVVVLFGSVRSGPFSPAVYAQQSRTVKEGVYTAAQAKRGEAIYKDRCASCHGENFAGSKAVARIAGQHEEYITKALHDYKSGLRSGGGVAAMAEVAYPLSDDEITALAHYLARL